uniref:DUF4880 domain-containing protein n=1 Tax=uncultured Caulobacter sp. TaxID=158749 RepID=UPI00345C3240
MAETHASRHLGTVPTGTPTRTRVKLTTIRESSADIDAAAAAWAGRVDRGPLSDQDQAALEAWAAQDPRRAGA